LQKLRSGGVNRDRTIWFSVSASGRRADLSSGGCDRLVVTQSCHDGGGNQSVTARYGKVSHEGIGGFRSNHSGTFAARSPTSSTCSAALPSCRSDRGWRGKVDESPDRQPRLSCPPGVAVTRSVRERVALGERDFRPDLRLARVLTTSRPFRAAVDQRASGVPSGRYARPAKASPLTASTSLGHVVGRRCRARHNRRTDETRPAGSG
jgi:hypothetical protein